MRIVVEVKAPYGEFRAVEVDGKFFCEIRPDAESEWDSHKCWNEQQAVRETLWLAVDHGDFHYGEE